MILCQRWILSRPMKEYHRLSWTIMGYMDYHGLSWTIMDKLRDLLTQKRKKKCENDPI